MECDEVGGSPEFEKLYICSDKERAYNSADIFGSVNLGGVIMNVYDEAHGLARAIKESQEFKHYSELREKVEANESINEMLKNFQQKQMELQAKAMMGEELGEEFQTTLQNLYGILAKDPLAAEYLQAEMQFSMMMNDVYKILGEAIGVNMSAAE